MYGGAKREVVGQKGKHLCYTACEVHMLNGLLCAGWLWWYAESRTTKRTCMIRMCQPASIRDMVLYTPGWGVRQAVTSR